jgi:hypothetical protein
MALGPIFTGSSGLRKKSNKYLNLMLKAVKIRGHSPIEPGNPKALN